MKIALTGAAGAATGFARTLPMRDEQVEGGLTRRGASAEQGFALRETCESEDKQIRFWEPEGRDSRRFAVGFISCFHIQPSPSRIGL